VTRTGSVVRPATPDDFPAIAELLDRTFGKQPYGDRLKLWKWRFDENPARTDVFPAFLVFEENGRIRGAHGLIPLRLKVENRELNASCSCDLAVDPKARSAGMKLKLAAMAKELSPFHLSTSANEPANRITLALGGREVAAGRLKYIKPLNVSGLMFRGWAKRGTPGKIVAKIGAMILKPVDWAMATARRARNPRPVEGANIRDIEFFDGRFDRFWEELAKDHAIVIVRDSPYLNWRYIRYPFPCVQSFELSRGEELLGFSVIHLSVDEDRLRFAALLELAGRKSEKVLLEQLLREAIRRASVGGAHYVIARAQTSDHGDLFREMGFTIRGKNYSTVSYKNNSDVSDKVFEEGSKWSLSLGDGDGCYFYNVNS
jgi:hypothetical protein